MIDIVLPFCSCDYLLNVYSLYLFQLYMRCRLLTIHIVVISIYEISLVSRFDFKKYYTIKKVIFQVRITIKKWSKNILTTWYKYLNLEIFIISKIWILNAYLKLLFVLCLRRFHSRELLTKHKQNTSAFK